MNYRHAFHAGNFADLLKHAVVLDLVARLTALPGHLTVIDTHAGAGVYNLRDGAAQRSGEAVAGIGRLMADLNLPGVLEALRSAVRNLSADGSLYPGSPHLITRALRPGDRYIGCELRPDDTASLVAVTSPFVGALALQADGYAAAVSRLPAPPARAMVLIDPPFERPDDYAQITATVASVLRANPATVLAVWLPIKDLETLDAFQRGLSVASASGAMVEARLRPLSDPMKMNGCAMLLLNPPAGATEAAMAAAAYIVAALGQNGRAVATQL